MPKSSTEPPHIKDTLNIIGTAKEPFHCVEVNTAEIVYTFHIHAYFCALLLVLEHNKLHTELAASLPLLFQTLTRANEYTLKDIA